MNTFISDKETFPAFHEDAQKWRESTTFLRDFEIARRFGGLDAIKETFNRAFEEWKNNAKYVCELAVVTNHLLWDAYNSGNTPLAKYYETCYYQCYDHIFASDDNGNNASPFTDDECAMIYKVLD